MPKGDWLFVYVMPVLAYLVGSIPFGVIVAKSRGVDLLKTGSGNVGATNVARTLGRKWGLLVFLLDMLKGLAPMLAAWMIINPAGGFPTVAQQFAWLAVGFAVIAGHVFSIFLGFRGGKGVATALGVVLGVWPYFTLAGLAAFGVWIIVLSASRYVSLASIVAAGAFAVLTAAFNPGRLAALWPLMSFALAMIALIILRHRSNIVRLLKGTENRFF